MEICERCGNPIHGDEASASAIGAKPLGPVHYPRCPMMDARFIYADGTSQHVRGFVPNPPHDEWSVQSDPLLGKGPARFRLERVDAGVAYYREISSPQH
jgi:hypothetical protein